MPLLTSAAISATGLLVAKAAWSFASGHACKKAHAWAVEATREFKNHDIPKAMERAWSEAVTQSTRAYLRENEGGVSSNHREWIEAVAAALCTKEMTTALFFSDPTAESSLLDLRRNPIPELDPSSLNAIAEPLVTLFRDCHERVNPAAPALPTTFYAAVHERLPQAIAFFYVEVVIKHDEKACKQVMWEIANSAHGKLDAIIDACQRVQDALATLTVTTRQTRAEVAAGRAENREGHAAIMRELAESRAIITQLTEAVSRLSSAPRDQGGPPPTSAQLYEQAVAAIAAERGIAPEKLREGIDHFIKAVKDNPNAAFMDRALADYAAQQFAAAAGNAGAAAEAARTRRLAARQAAQLAAQLEQQARDEEVKALSLQGRAFSAGSQFGAAVEAFRRAAALFDPAARSAAWASLQFEIGKAASEWAPRSEGSDVAQRRELAIRSYRAALEVLTRAVLPQAWAQTQDNLAIALHDQAAASEGGERARLLGEAVAAYRDALQVRTRAALPQAWATTQNNLAIAKSDQAAASEGPERARLLGEAVVAYREALQVFTRAALPEAWATTQNNLANALRAQAEASEGTDRARLMGEAVAAYREALQVRTRAALPQAWANTQNNLALALRDQSAGVVGTDRVRLLREAAAAMRACIEVLNAPWQTKPRLAWIAEVEAEIHALGQNDPPPPPAASS